MNAPSETPFAWPAGKRGAVSLTFDDARPSAIQRGVPILDRHGVKGSFYVVADRMDPHLDAWRAALAAGHEIGNHSVHHPCSGNFRWTRERALEEYTLEQMDAELAEAQEQIHARLGVRPVTFAYPCGQTFVGRGEALRSYIPLVAKRFIVGRTYNAEIHNDPAYCDLAHATGMGFDALSFEQVRVLIDATAAAGGWLILAGHNVGETGYQIVGEDMLAAVCRYCLDPANGVWIDTVAAVGSFIIKTRGEWVGGEVVLATDAHK